MRPAASLTIDTVAIYSDADKNALHVKYADEAFHVGEAHPSKSYLNMERILTLQKERRRSNTSRVRVPCRKLPLPTLS